MCVMCHSDVRFINLSRVFHHAALPGGLHSAPITVLELFCPAVHRRMSADT